MKYLLFIVLLVAVVITTGCVSENKSSAVTPTAPFFIRWLSLFEWNRGGGD